MRVCIINPTSSVDSAQVSAEFPIGLGILSGILRSQVEKVAIIDYQLKQVNIIKEITEKKWDIVGISLNYTCSAKGISQIISKIKSLPKPPYILLGGNHATFTAKDIIANQEVDYILRYETENTLPKLLSCLDKKEDLLDVQGVVFKSEGEIYTNDSMNPVTDLDSLPAIPYKELGAEEYYGEDSFFPILTSRGCPFNCIFCASRKFWGNRMRFRSIPNVLEEIDLLNSEFGIKQFNFRDDIFTVSDKRTNLLLDELLKKEYHWSCETRVDFLNQDIVRKMKESGCVQIRLGLETANQKTLDLLDKQFTIEQFDQTMKMILEAEIPNPRVSLMFGLPGETFDDVMQTINHLKNLPKNVEFMIGAFTPLPGTQIFEQREDYGIQFVTDDWAEMNPYKSAIKTDLLTNAQINELLLIAQDELIISRI